MREQFFEHIDIDPANIHIPDGTLPRERLAQHCAAYERAIAEAGGIDFQLLGIGRTGHIGFNEPGSAEDSRTRLVRIWIAALAVLLLADLASGRIVRERLARTLGDWVVEQRLQLTLAGVAMFASRPVLGVGPGGFAEELDRVGANLPALTDYLPTPHNALVQMAAEAGVPGLLAFVLFVGRAWWRVLLQARRSAEAEASAQSLAEAALWSVTAGLLASLFLWPLSHGAGEAFVLALALGLAGVGSPEPAGARGAPP
jgi:O-antigen ligase